MTLVWPLALLGLLAIPVLILLDRWRRRPKARTWPSLQLWRVVQELDAPTQRRVQPLLLYECAAILLLVLAAAGPVVSGAEEPEIVVLVDTGPHMQARRGEGSVLDATLKEVEKIPGNKRRIDVDGDLVQAATSFDQPVVLATNRPGVEGAGYVVVGRAAEGNNIGIDAVEIRGEQVWFALATDGEPREFEVSVGEHTMRVKTGVGATAKIGSPILVHHIDNYDGDNACSFRPVAPTVRHDTDSPYLIAALESGLLTLKSTDSFANLVIETKGGTPIEGVVRGAHCVADSGLFDGLVLDGCAWTGVRGLTDLEVAAKGGTLAGSGGRSRLTYRGQTVAYWYGRTLWLGLPLDRDWDEQGTLAVLIDRAKRAVVKKGPDEVWVGDFLATPAPGFVDTRGVDRPWDGTIPTGTEAGAEESSLSWVLALLAVAVLALYVRAMLRA